MRLFARKKPAAGRAEKRAAPGKGLSAVLSRMDGKPEVYENTDELRENMAKAGAEETDILKVCLMTKVSGFAELLGKDSPTTQISLDRFIRNAVEETGFNRMEAMELTRAIVWSVGGAFDYKPGRAAPDGGSERAYTIPANLYQSELKSFGDAFTQAVYQGQDVSKLDFGRLEPLVAAGLPKAQFYLGYCLLHGVKLEEDSGRGVELLQSAANAGDIEAAAALGDYYFAQGPKEWGQAYSYYTGYGALALNQKRRDAIVSIFNQKKYNGRLIACSALFLAAMILTMALAPGSAAYAPHRVLGRLCAAAGGMVFAGSLVRYFNEPYGSYHWGIVGMMALWSVHTAVRLLF